MCERSAKLIRSAAANGGGATKDMSFHRIPPQTYVPWKPNSDFTKFFNDLKNRRIAAPQSADTVRVSDKPAVAISTQSNHSKVNHSGVSETITRTAQDQIGRHKTTKARRKTVSKRPGAVKKTTAGKPRQLESRLRKANL